MDLLAGFVGIWMVFVIYIAVGVEGVAYDATCTVDGDCTDTNANNCVDDGTNKQCKCNADSFRRTSPAECVIKILAGATCITGDECADSNAACDGSACLCGANFFQTNENTCGSKVANLEGTCDATETSTDQCTVADSECRANQCLCKDTHYKSSGTSCATRKAPEATCSTGECVTHATCDTTCKCDAGYTATPSTSPTMCQSNGVKFATLPYMYLVPILVSIMSLLR